VRRILLAQLAAFAVGSLVSANGHAAAAPSAAGPTATFSCSPIGVHDGDTLTCSDMTRVRVAGINAREIGWDGRKNIDQGCNNAAPCPTVDAVAARDRLVTLLGKPAGLDTNGNMRLAGPPLTCVPNGKTYNRVAAFCTTAAGVDVSCAMLASGAAAKWDKFWQGRRC
jgi:endonuclease YncB( thermonuclease family)